MTIKLYNRDGADLQLKRGKQVEPNIYEWMLTVDKEHQYCLQYMRVIMTEDQSKIEAVDPSGGPYISLSDEFEDKYEIENKYKIVDILNPTTFWISETNNNK